MNDKKSIFAYDRGEVVEFPDRMGKYTILYKDVDLDNYIDIYATADPFSLCRFRHDAHTEAYIEWHFIGSLVAIKKNKEKTFKKIRKQFDERTEKAVRLICEIENEQPYYKIAK